MWYAENGINDTFSDIIELFSKCKYSDCSHGKEPGCAINKSISEGTLSMERWKMYCCLLNENEWGKNKSIYTKKGKLENKIKRGKNK